MKHFVFALAAFAGALATTAAMAVAAPPHTVRIVVHHEIGHADVGVVAHPSSDGDVHVKVSAAHGDVNDLPVGVERGDTTTVSAIYRVDRGILWFLNIDRFTIDVSVPEGAKLIVSNDLGGVDINGRFPYVEGLTGNGGLRVTGSPDVNARTGNGGITIKDARAVFARTGNGGVDATLAPGVPKIDIRTGNGGIRLQLAPNATTRVDAQTGNGGIANPLKDGTGPGTIVLRTGNGGIDVVVPH